MASIYFPPQSQPGFSQHFDSSPPDTKSNRRISMPHLPNPPFVFPARDPDAPVSDPQDSEQRTPPALPAFSFNPGSEQSSSPPSHVPYRPNGHRRRPSEFVGDNQLVTPGSGDAEKREEPATQTQPSVPAPGPPRGPGRRHHAHRRSAAVSGVDMNAIQKALATPQGAVSAPNTPGDQLFDKGTEDTSRPLSYSAGSLGRPTPPASPQFPPASYIPPVPPIPPALQAEAAIPAIPNNDDAEIGRPVSAAFIETPESPAVVQSEPLQILTPPAEKRPQQNRKAKPRPKTADASLAFDFMQSQQVPDVPNVKRSKSTGHSRSRKSRSAANLLATQGGDDAHSTDTSRPSYSDDGSEMSSDNEDDHEDDDSSPKKSRSKSKKKQKRVRSWAGAILTRGKGKRHAKNEGEAVESPEKVKCKGKEKKLPPALTPPMLTRTNSEANSFMEVDFDNDDVVILRTPTNPEGPVSSAQEAQDSSPVPAPSLESSWKPRSFYEQTAHDDTLSSPVIDLDAALGPFNTPDMRPREGGQSKFSVATQRMYSGGRRGEFVGPEMRYHRRTESAPVMQPFDRSSLGPIRLGGKGGAETPDVFDEEEEDEFLAANQSPRNGRVAPAEDPVSTFSAPSEGDKPSSESVKSTTSADTLTRAPEPNPAQPEGLGIQASEEPASPKEAPIEGREASTLPAINPFAGPSSRDPADSLKPEKPTLKKLAPPSPDISPRFLAVDKRPSTSPNQLPPSIPPFSLSAGVSPSDSSFPSPDAPRFSDRNFSSHSYQTLPTDYHYASVEDVPSLTSSASTNTMNRFSATFFPRSRLSTDRAASFSAAVHRRSSQANSSKRSSLASLSKLVGAGHSERSKLYQEEKPPEDAHETSRKKSRRITRLMHFWKGKDKEKSATEPSIPEQPV